MIRFNRLNGFITIIEAGLILEFEADFLKQSNPVRLSAYLAR